MTIFLNILKLYDSKSQAPDCNNFNSVGVPDLGHPGPLTSIVVDLSLDVGVHGPGTPTTVVKPQRPNSQKNSVLTHAA